MRRDEPEWLLSGWISNYEGVAMMQAFAAISNHEIETQILLAESRRASAKAG
jgi:hypothetical protein